MLDANLSLQMYPQELHKGELWNVGSYVFLLWWWLWLVRDHTGSKRLQNENRLDLKPDEHYILREQDGERGGLPGQDLSVGRMGTKYSVTENWFVGNTPFERYLYSVGTTCIYQSNMNNRWQHCLPRKATDCREYQVLDFHLGCRWCFVDLVDKSDPVNQLHIGCQEKRNTSFWPADDLTYKGYLYKYISWIFSSAGALFIILPKCCNYKRLSEHYW